MTRGVLGPALFAIVATAARAEAAELFVHTDCAGIPGDCYTNIQAAVDAASNEDKILVYPGTYEGRVQIDPPVGDQPIPFFEVTLRAFDAENPPLLQWGHSDIGHEFPIAAQAVIEVRNRIVAGSSALRLSEHLKVSIRDLRVRGRIRAAAISVQNAYPDVDQRCLIEIHIRNNLLVVEDTQWAALILGRKPLRGPQMVEKLRNQSLMYGEVVGNSIDASKDGGPLHDAITAHHYVGLVQGNRVHSASEGLHLGYARTDYRHTGRVPIEYNEALLQHNVFFCNARSGLHFTHGSIGTIRNNIFLLNWGIRHTGFGLNVGTYKLPFVISGQGCGAPSTNGETELMPFVVATIHNNVFDRNRDAGLYISPEAQPVSVHSNVFSRTGVDTRWPDGDPGIGVKSGSGQLPGQWDSDYNVFWMNDDHCDPDDMAGDNDLIGDPGFAGASTTGSPIFSYMLRGDPDEHPSPCGYHVLPGEASEAIDAGTTDEDFDDALNGPSLGGPRNDAGAYGGPWNIWDPAGQDSCWQPDTDPSTPCAAYVQ